MCRQLAEETNVHGHRDGEALHARLLDSPLVDLQLCWLHERKYSFFKVALTFGEDCTPKITIYQPGAWVGNVGSWGFRTQSPIWPVSAPCPRSVCLNPSPYRTVALSLIHI